MTERPPTSALGSRPTAEQILRFSKLTAEQRFQWLVDTLALCYDLTPAEIRAQWRAHKARG